MSNLRPLLCDTRGDTRSHFSPKLVKAKMIFLKFYNLSTKISLASNSLSKCLIGTWLLCCYCFKQSSRNYIQRTIKVYIFLFIRLQRWLAIFFIRLQCWLAIDFRRHLKLSSTVFVYVSIVYIGLPSLLLFVFI